MTLRQVWVRIKALPWDSPLQIALRAELDAAKEAAEIDELEDIQARLIPQRLLERG